MAIVRDEGARSGTVAGLFRNAHATSGVPGLWSDHSGLDDKTKREQSHLHVS